MSPPGVTATSRPLDAVRVQRLLQKFGVPRRLRDAVVVRLKRLIAPGAETERRAAVGSLPAPAGLDIEALRRDGAARPPDAALPHAAQAARSAMEIFESFGARDAFQKTQTHRKANFLVTLMKDEELLAAPGIAEFALSDEMLGAVSCYLGGAPVLSQIKLWWSPPNETMLESQQYHFDAEDRTQLKVFLNVNEIGPDAGPFTYLSAVDSAKIPRGRRASRRLTDDVVAQHVGPDAAVKLTGPPGRVSMVDTSRCLHYGSRGNTADRLMVMVQFTRFLAPKAKTPMWTASRILNGDLDGVRRLVLNLPASDRR